MPASKILSFLPAAIVGLAVVSTPLLAALEPYEEDGEAAAFYPLGWSVSDVFVATAEAEVSVVRYGAAENIAIVRITSSENAAALRASGAWLVLNAQAMGGCLIGPEYDGVQSAALQNPRGVI
jgi:hypothetical protein